MPREEAGLDARRAAGAFCGAVPPARRTAVLLLLGTSTAACGKADVSVKYASNFVPAHHKVSVFGVFKDGRMNTEAWGGVSARISAALGGGHCDVGYGAAPFQPGLEISAAIDEYTTSNGPTDDLLGEIAPAAAGDLVLVLTVAGRLPAPVKIHVQDEGKKPTGQNSARGMLRKEKHDEDTNELQLAAQFFSVAERKTVAVVNIDYKGQSIDEANEKFAAEITQSLPDSQCAGWNVSAKIDPEKIRQLGQ